MEVIMTTTIGLLIGLKTAVLAIVAKKYTLVNKNRVHKEKK
jgi:hypothetical protein